MTAASVATKPITITAAQARAYLLSRAGAFYHPDGPAPDPTTLVEQIGILQVDPVAVVAANHHLVAHARMPHYLPAHLDTALYQERTLVESFHGIHAILPMADWRFYDRRLMPKTRWELRYDAEAGPVMERILGAIRDQGPLASRDFSSEDDRVRMQYGWGETAKAQMALQILLRRGFLMVHHRVGTQRVYDLTERIVPPHVDTTPVTEEERARHFGLRNLRYDGIAMGTGGIQVAIKAGDTVPVTIEGLRAKFFTTPDQVEAIAATAPIPEGARRAVLLPPLDPLIHHRQRLLALFSFDYLWEVYTPVAKRKYGPYTLPVLWGDRFVARLDPSLDRKRGVLVVRDLWFEPDAPDAAALYADLAAEIARFAAFHGDAAVALGNVHPPKRDRRVRAALKRAIALAPYRLRQRRP
jgi:uncharacterized protein YcaQ